MRKLTTEEFILRAKEIHGGKYDYSLSQYINARTKVKIICHKHGVFEQIPSQHTWGTGSGCPNCAVTKRLSTEEFVRRAISVHGDKYDYALCQYISKKEKVKIICPEHGVFNQFPGDHERGIGCLKCGIIKRSNKNRLPREEFIKRFISIHGNKYDYSLYQHVSTRENIKIICPEHGVFEQTPNNHLAGNGCQACAGRKQPTTEEFIEEAKKIHGDKYDYSECVYVNRKTKVKIICPEHGVFEQTAHNHINGSGCPCCGVIECANKNRSTTKEFIEKAKQVHGNKYDYSLCVYVNCATKVKIICPIHEVFEQVPSSHLSGHGCLACVGCKQPTTEEFIEEAKKIHGDKYDYSECVYVNRKTKVKIICPEHGIFEQAPNNHIGQRHGCPTCAGCKQPTTEEFVEKAKQVHGDKYDYSECVYVNTKTKVKIICPEHGVFEPSPNNHISKKSGCPGCTKTGFNFNKPGLLYLLKFEKPLASFWKVGITNYTIQKRFRHDHDFVVHKYSWNFDDGFDAYKTEQKVLKEFKKYKFDDSFLFSLLEVGGDTECFIPSMPHQKVVDFIESKVRSYQTT